MEQHMCLCGTMLFLSSLLRSSVCVLAFRRTASSQFGWIMLVNSPLKHLMTIVLLWALTYSTVYPMFTLKNGLAKSLIKRIKLIARPLLQDSRLPTSCWGHAVLHAVALIQYRPSAHRFASPHQLARGQEPEISHLRKFGYAVYMPISPPQRITMGPHRKLGVYVGVCIY
jgi:hypothetical protein